MNPFRTCVALCLATALCAVEASAQERTPQIEVQTSGRVTNFQTGGDGWGGVIKEIQALRQIPREQDASVIAKLTAKLDDLPAPYAYEVVRRTCNTDPKKASYLFALTGGRVRYDAFRCADSTAKAGIQATMFSLQMPECKEMLSDLQLSLDALRQVRDSKEMFSSKASPWWICSHGMRAMTAGLEKKTLAMSDWLRPEADWPAIQNELRGQIDYTLDKYSKR
jgi:hypothetical protein